MEEDRGTVRFTKSQYQPGRVRDAAAFYTYEAINHVPAGKTFTQGPYIIRPSNGFIYMIKKTYDEDNGVDFGLKFHVSVDDEDFENVAKAWNLIKDILISYKVTTAKVIERGKRLAELNPKQRGKQITMYQFRDTGLNWQEIIREITRILTENEIKPGYAPPSDNPVPGTNYVYYRTDLSVDGKYLEGGEVPGEIDPNVEKFQKEVKGQLPVKEWHPAAGMRPK